MRPNPSTTILAALLAAFLLAPSASAGWLSRDPVTIDVPILRVGDRLLLATTVTAPDGAREGVDVGASETVVLVEGVGAVADRFGVPRDVETFRVDHREGGEVVSAARCHRLAGGRDAVRLEPLFGMSASFAWGTGDLFGLSGRARHEANHTLLALYGGACEEPATLGPRTFRAGDRVRAGDVFPFTAGPDADVLSSPAEAADFHGRQALRFSFDPARMRDPEARGFSALEVVLADGLPAVAAMSVDGRGEFEGVQYRRTVAGIERGAGQPLQPFRGAALPAESPFASFAPPPLRGLDDAAYDFAFRYEEAYQALFQDPTTGFGAWLQKHPRAVLWTASLGREEPGSDPLVRSGGVWYLAFRDGDAVFRANVQRFDSPSPLAPAGVAKSFAAHEETLQEPTSAFVPARVADSRSLARAVHGAGVDLSQVVWFTYLAEQHGERGLVQVVFSTTSMTSGDDEGLEVHLDALSGGVDSLYATSVRTERDGGILAPADGSVRVERTATALSVLAGPGPGSGLAVGGAAATGLALLLVFLKFVAVPLFTRLRRDRLLDNPVRARLHERIRAEPGIHLAELVDFTGLGKGATRHHVDQLVKHRLVVEAQDGGFARYFCAGEVPPEVARREMVLRAGATREVYDLLAAEPGLSLREAAARLGMAAPTVHRYRKRLEKAGLLPAAPQAHVKPAEA